MKDCVHKFCPDVAIIGFSGRFPGAETVQQFWLNLCGGVESISTIPRERNASSSPEKNCRRSAGPQGGVLEGIDLFDAGFFNFSPREADVTDPQHRIFLECAWEALESAGYDPGSYNGSIGVFGGVGPAWYGHRFYADPALLKALGEMQVMIGNEDHFLTTKVSYKLDLRGPSIVTHSACSTSLVAVHLACQSVLSGESDIALAGGASLPLLAFSAGDWSSASSENGGIIASDGHCRAFDAAAGGTIPGEGAGIVALKRLDFAMRDGDFIHAVIKASAVNNDGANKAYYTAPSAAGQAHVIAEAMALAQVSPETVTFVEAHGTGTPIGDPIEVRALSDAFTVGGSQKQFCAIGSVKTNVGHLDAAAGVVGLIKAVLALENKRIPPSLHFMEPNPEIDFSNTPFYVNTKLSEWKQGAAPRRAGVNAFGFGGTNAHVILEEAPPQPAAPRSRNYNLWVLSAKTPAALDRLTANLAYHLSEHPETDLADAAYTLQAGRKAFPYRRTLVTSADDRVIDALHGLTATPVTSVRTTAPSIRFLFPGQGAQYVNMARQLYKAEPVFRATVDQCSDLLVPFLDRDLRTMLYPNDPIAEEGQSSLNETIYTQPALFVIEYALAQMWKLWGIEPEAMLGNSIGEYVAACLAGVFSLEEALRLVSARGKLIQSLEPGAMLSVPFGEEEARSLVCPEISLALVSGPATCVMSGSVERIHQLKDQLAGRGVNAVLLATSHAFHSHMMERALPAFHEMVSKIKLQRPKIPFISNVTGTWITDSAATDPAYWVKHLRQTVRLADGIEELLRTPNPLLVEVGPGKTLSNLIQQRRSSGCQIPVLCSVRHPRQQVPDQQFILESMAQLWAAGAKVDWKGFHHNEKRRRVPLPTYPFERESYWIEPAKRTESRNEMAFTGKFDSSQTAATPDPRQFTGHDRSLTNNGYGAKSHNHNGKDRTSDGQAADLKGHPRPALSTPFSPPSNKTEEAVCRIWETLLGIRGIGIHDDLFDLGGQSLTAIQLISHLRSAFTVDIPVNAVFEGPTVASISKIVDQLTAAAKPLVSASIARIPRAASRLNALKTPMEKTGTLS